MKKIKQTLFIFLSCMIATTPLSSCAVIENFIDDNCQHDWELYIAKNPTCVTNGILEMNCKLCGEKEFKELLSSGHTYKNNVCDICGEINDGSGLSKFPLPENVSTKGKWTFQDILKTVYELTPYDPDEYTYETLLSDISTGYAQDIYLDPLNLLHFNAIQKSEYFNTLPMEASLAIPVERVEIKNPEEKKSSNIYRVESNNNEMWITYNDGLQISAGKFLSKDDQSVIIEALGINKNNELVVYYNNATVAFAGQVSENKTKENQSIFLYHQLEDGFSIVQSLDKQAEHITLPLTHRGKPIGRIESNAFYDLTNLKSITLSKNINHIDEYAFNLTSLEYVIIPDCNITFVNPAFYLLNETKFFFEGTQDQYTAVDSDFPSKNFFFKGDWIYVDGVPRGFVS